MIHITPVVLCGGSGTRLWPLSRAGFPKQFLCLTGHHSLFQQAFHRLSALDGPEIQPAPALVVAGEEHRFLLLDQLRDIGAELEAVILEPAARNTAAALTLAALHAIEQGTDPVLVVTPADQDIPDTEAFVAAAQAAILEALQGTIVVLGITPNAPNTGYGYIQADGSAASLNPKVVKHFAEKPDLLTATEYVNQGGYFWNAGMFVLKASTWLKSLEEFRPDILRTTQAAWSAKTSDSQFLRPCATQFATIPSESIDRAVIERCPGSPFAVKMVPLSAGWNDLGAWDAIWDALPKDEGGNAHVGDVMSSQCQNTLVHASSRLVSLVGVKDLIVVETPDAVLVMDKAHSQEVRDVVATLQTRDRSEYTQHRKVHRPWGWYDKIDEGPRFKVKRIQVKPGASLSLQKHYHRAEHWVVVSGTAEVTAGETSMLLTENQSTYIPLGEVHRLSNPGITPLEIIEVQSGSYLQEDDIVRFDDFYGRQE